MRRIAVTTTCSRERFARAEHCARDAREVGFLCGHLARRAARLEVDNVDVADIDVSVSLLDHRADLGLGSEIPISLRAAQVALGANEYH